MPDFITKLALNFSFVAFILLHSSDRFCIGWIKSLIYNLSKKKFLRIGITSGELTEACSEPFQIFNLELFAKIVKGCQCCLCFPLLVLTLEFTNC